MKKMPKNLILGPIFEFNAVSAFFFVETRAVA